MLTYALIVTNKNLKEDIYIKIKQLTQAYLKRLHKVSGEYDLFVELKLQNEQKMVDVLNKMRNIEGVSILRTFTVIHKTKEHDQVPKSLLY